MLLNNEKTYIGFDLSYNYAQISYCRQGEKEPETYEVAAGEEQYRIPAALFKRKGINQWFVGKEAENFAKQEDGTLLNGLYQLALDRESIQIENEEFETIALLVLFVKLALAFPRRNYRLEKVAGIMFTVPGLDDRSVEILGRMALLLNLESTEIFFQGREESIYQYAVNEVSEIWKEEIAVFDGHEKGMDCIRLTKNENTTPVVIFSDVSACRDISGTDEEKDALFDEIVGEEKISPSSVVFLIGEKFYGDWCRESLQGLCRNCRVFKGNNLYSKGACYSVMSRMKVIQNENKYVFLGKDKLKTNIGMQVKRNGADSYLAILDGGENWFECRKEFHVILPEGNSLQFIITPLDGRNIQSVEIFLEGLPERPKNMTRLKICAEMTDDVTLNLTIEDMGFGDFYPATGMKFEQQINLSDGGY